MKSIKSAKAFLFCIAAVMTVLFAVAISKPYNTVSAGADSNVNKNNGVNTGLTEDIARSYDTSDLSESVQNESEADTAESDDNKSEPSITSRIEESEESRKTDSFSEPKTENTTAKAAITAPSETKKPTAPQTQKETAEKHTTPTAVPTPDDPEQMTVYYTKTGKRYHYANPCGKGTYYPTTLAEAKKMGLTPCQKCVLH